MKGHKLQERAVYSILENGALERDFNRHIIRTFQQRKPTFNLNKGEDCWGCVKR